MYDKYQSKYDRDYFERGIETRTSLYTNYRWIPELTIPLAYRIVKQLGIMETDKILDYGCAKGFLVKALRLLGFEAFGYDISEYAIDNVPYDTSAYVYHGVSWMTRKWDVVIAKDVFEHIPYNHLADVLKDLARCSKRIFVIVPISTNGDQYNEPAYELDKTHIIRENLQWWESIIQKNYGKLSIMSTSMHGIKDNWPSNSNGFFIASSDEIMF